MSRKREGSIAESPQRIESLLRIHTGGSCESRLRMLLLLCNDPTTTITEAASAVHCSERTVRRWWKAYQKGGLKGLLGEECDCDGQSADQAMAEGMAASVVPAHLLRFLNSLPVTDDTVEWITCFREGLKRLLGDVDRVTVNVDTECDPYSVDEGGMEFFVTHHVTDALQHRRNSEVTTQRADRKPSELLLNSFRSKKFPVDDYHPPVCFDYYAAGGAYIGTIILWRERHARSISERSLALMRQMEPFLVFLLSDCIERRRQERPDLRLFTRIVEFVGNAEGLTMREKEVLLHHLLGKDHKTIGWHLDISVPTVRKHIKAVHDKACVSSCNELIARYVVPGSGAGTQVKG